jgi:hypothetical protein
MSRCIEQCVLPRQCLRLRITTQSMCQAEHHQDETLAMDDVVYAEGLCNLKPSSRFDGLVIRVK